MKSILAQEFSVKESYVENIINLLDEGMTVPFIARYRKEMHGTMDDQIIREIADRLNYLRNLEKRKEEVINSITEKDKMTDELLANINEAKTLARVEDLYRPYKDKRKTRATVAVAKGLEPLSKIILEQQTSLEDIKKEAENFITEEVLTVDDALKGACDILAEVISDDPLVREKLKNYYTKHGIIDTKKAKDETSVYEMYYEYSEPVAKIQNHRILAINRGEKEGFLKVKLASTDTLAIHLIYNLYITCDLIRPLMAEICEDSFSRLIFPSIEREIRSGLTERASEQAISVFGVNLVGLLMQAPIKDKTCLAIDPAYRTGCKIAVCDKTGKVLATNVIYCTMPHDKVEVARKTIIDLVKKHDVEIIAVGNGTASKEAEIFTVDTIKVIKKENLAYMMVNEAGASVYSASKLGAEEFPDYDVALRSAVSIARRLQDPLAELVKIDPKSIGVGQYQHDMPQARLSEVLTNTVEDCVNKVGVDLNTASAPLLTYIAGLSSAVAKNVVTYREENGQFKSRKELLKVAKLGPKAYLQCAGFLRVADSKNLLDNTSVHPESYDIANKLLEILGYKKETDFSTIEEKCNAYGIDKLCAEIEVGRPTLEDIIAELAKPGRDIRAEGEQPVLRTDILDMKDLKPGMELMGTVRNVIDFGVFVDIAVHQDGLVHISQITDRYIKHPSEVLKVGDVVKVWVMSVDVPKKRIALTMKEANK
ncbi:MAG: Tex family protein [Clostridia bacterium]